MADLFVSYKSEDRPRVAPLVAALEADGVSIWWDAHIGGGSEWRETIEAELNAGRCVLVVWSERSVGREGSFVRDEATRALRRGELQHIDFVTPSCRQTATDGFRAGTNCHRRRCVYTVCG